ncbi:DUF4423 domain-containing protein [Fibrobacter sp.]|uniref:DUF4423 domain-containing protein n=1 Tax=Fibrobacter sp. TaxID=35828 RepID=UPI00388E3057
MLNIDEISDYRDLLKNYFTQRKLDMPLYSYKMMGQKLGLETSQMFRVLNKELHLPNRSIPLAKDLLDLKGRSGEIFEILVAASKTKSPAKKDKLYKMALSLQDVDLRKFSASEYLFLSKWWIPVVRALIEMNGGRAEISHLVKQISPAVSEDQVREALAVLKDLKLITPLASGRYAATAANFTSAGSPTKTAAIRSYQNQLLALAQNALVAVEPAKRNISSLLVGVDDDCFADLNEMTLEFRRQVQKRVAEVKDASRAMQFVFALYPVAEMPNAEMAANKKQSAKVRVEK